MVISLKDLIQKKSFNSKEEIIIIAVFRETYHGFNKGNFSFDKGILRFKNISSPMRMSILMNKNIFLQQLKEKGLYIRDIL